MVSKLEPKRNVYKLHIEEGNEPTVCQWCLSLANEMMPGIRYTIVEPLEHCEKCEEGETTMPDRICVQEVSGFRCNANVSPDSAGYENFRCPEHFAYHMNKREVILTLDESAGVYRCTSDNCSHDFSPYFGRDFAEVRDIRYTMQRLENLGFRVTLIEKSDMDTLNPAGVVDPMRVESTFAGYCDYCDCEIPYGGSHVDYSNLCVACGDRQANPADYCADCGAFMLEETWIVDGTWTLCPACLAKLEKKMDSEKTILDDLSDIQFRNDVFFIDGSKTNHYFLTLEQAKESAEKWRTFPGKFYPPVAYVQTRTSAGELLQTIGIDNPKYCADCGYWNAQENEWCSACGNYRFLQDADFLQETICSKCSVSFDSEIETEHGLCPACYWHNHHSRIPFLDYQRYAQSLQNAGFVVPVPNRVYEFESDNFQGFQNGEPFNISLISTGFANPIYCLSNGFSSEAVLGFVQHPSGSFICNVQRPLLALAAGSFDGYECPGCDHTYDYLFTSGFCRNCDEMENSYFAELLQETLDTLWSDVRELAVSYAMRDRNTDNYFFRYGLRYLAVAESKFRDKETPTHNALIWRELEYVTSQLNYARNDLLPRYKMI